MIKIIDNCKGKFGKHIYESVENAQNAIDELIAVCKENNVPYDYDVADLPYDMSFDEYQKFIENDGHSVYEIYKCVLDDCENGMDMIKNLDTAKEIIKMLVADPCCENSTLDYYTMDLKNQANDKIIDLIDQLIEVKKDSFNQEYCSRLDARCRDMERGKSCDTCKEEYYEHKREELIEEYKMTIS